MKCNKLWRVCYGIIQTMWRRLQAFTAIKLNKISGWQPSQVIQSGGFWQSYWGQNDSDGVGSAEPPDALSAGKDFIEN